jgi:uncharacterized membrane protein YphA (DoxX/SURF4 family)
MGRFVKELRFTRGYKHVWIPRLVAGLSLVGFGVIHLLNPGPLRQVLYAVGFPQVNAMIAPLIEILAGALLLTGFFARVGGLLGLSTMLPASYATVTLDEMSLAELPWGLAKVPEVPHLALPLVVLLASAWIVRTGGGAWSLDHKATSGSA